MNRSGRSVSVQHPRSPSHASEQVVKKRSGSDNMTPALSVNTMDASTPNICKLFIGGLSYETTDESLQEYFEDYGPVDSAVVLRDPTTLRSRGFGFVTFKTYEAASSVVSETRHLIDGRKVEAKFAVPRAATPTGSSTPTASSASSTTSSSSSMNGGSGKAPKTPRTPTMQAVLVAAASSGRNVDVSSSPTKANYSAAVKQGVNSGSRSSSVDSDDVVTEKNNGSNSNTDDNQSETGSTRDSVRSDSLDSDNNNSSSSNSSSGSSSSKTGGIISNKIFVGGLLYASTDESLKAYFEEYGEVETCEVIYNRDTKKSRGFGFVIFKGHEAVSKVLAAQDREKTLVLDGKQIEVKRCVAKQDAATKPSSGSVDDDKISTTSSSVASQVAAHNNINKAMMESGVYQQQQPSITPWGTKQVSFSSTGSSNGGSVIGSPLSSSIPHLTIDEETYDFYLEDQFANDDFYEDEYHSRTVSSSSSSSSTFLSSFTSGSPHHSDQHSVSAFSPRHEDFNAAVPPQHVLTSRSSGGSTNSHGSNSRGNSSPMHHGSSPLPSLEGLHINTVTSPRNVPASPLADSSGGIWGSPTHRSSKSLGGPGDGFFISQQQQQQQRNRHHSHSYDRPAPLQYQPPRSPLATQFSPSLTVDGFVSPLPSPHVQHYPQHSPSRFDHYSNNSGIPSTPMSTASAPANYGFVSSPHHYQYHHGVSQQQQQQQQHHHQQQQPQQHQAQQYYY